MKKNIKKSLVVSIFYALVLTSCRAVGSSMNMQKDSYKDVSMKNKLVFEVSRAYSDAAKAADVARAAYEEARVKARNATPEDKATAIAAVKAAEAEWEAKDAATDCS